MRNKISKRRFPENFNIKRQYRPGVALTGTIIVLAVICIWAFLPGKLPPGKLAEQQPAYSNSPNVSDSAGVPGSDSTVPGESASPNQTGPSDAPSDTPKEGKDEAGNDGISFTMTAVGDILLGRGVGNTVIYNGLEFSYPFEEVKDLLGPADIIFGNLEQPISSKGTPFTDKITLKSVPKSIEGILYAGFNLLNLANNHIMDYGEDALEDTLDILKASNIYYAGAGKNIDEAKKPAIMNINGKKVGFLAYTEMWEYWFTHPHGNRKFVAEENLPGVAPFIDEMIIEDVEKLKDQVDFLIVSLHWGIEDSFDVTEEQIKFAHLLIDKGVDLILGHHPHQVQGIEVYKSKAIAYSLGNFLFDQYEPENQEGIILRLEYENRKLIKMEAFPTRTINMSRIVPQKGKDALSILERQKALSEDLGTNCTILDDRLKYVIE